MKRLSTLLLFLFASLSLRSATMQFYYTNWDNTVSTSAWVRILPGSQPMHDDNFIVTGPPQRVRLTNGFVQIVQRKGTYEAIAEGDVNGFVYEVPDDSSTYIASNLRVKSLITFLSNGAGIGAGTNVTFTTNGATIIINSTGGTAAPTITTNAGSWFWAASASSATELLGTKKGNYMIWATSSDGLTWTGAVNPAYWEPNYYTNYLVSTDNGHAGPWARDGALQNCNGEWWYCYNFDPFNTNNLAQGLGLARSTDGTNWSRHAVIYPKGTNNVGGRMFAATWFTDNDGSNYLIGVYGFNINSPGPDFGAFQIRRLDDSFTNWSSPVTITPSGGEPFKWDAYIQREGSSYAMYYAGSSAIARATRSDLAGAFGAGTDLGWGTGEAPSVIKITPTHWRGMWRNANGTMQYTETTDSGSTWDTTCRSLTNIVFETPWHAYKTYAVFDGGCAESQWYEESLDGGATWGSPTVTIVTSPLWHGAGIAYISASNSPLAAVNTDYRIGTNSGRVTIVPPVLAANTVNAKVLNSEGIISHDAYFYGTAGADKFSLGAGDATVMLFAFGATPTFAAPNGSLCLVNTGQPYVRKANAWEPIELSTTTGPGPWSTNSGKIYDVLANTTGGAVGIGTNNPQSTLHIRKDSQGDDDPGQLLIENRADVTDPSVPNASGFKLFNRHMTQPWQVKSDMNDLRFTRYQESADFLVVDSNGNVGVTNKMTVSSDFTNTPLAGSGRRLVEADANGKLYALLATNTVGAGAANFVTNASTAQGTFYAGVDVGGVFSAASTGVIGTNQIHSTNMFQVAVPVGTPGVKRKIFEVETNGNVYVDGGLYFGRGGNNSDTGLRGVSSSEIVAAGLADALIGIRVDKLFASSSVESVGGYYLNTNASRYQIIDNQNNATFKTLNVTNASALQSTTVVGTNVIHGTNIFQVAVPSTGTTPDRKAFEVTTDDKVFVAGALTVGGNITNNSQVLSADGTVSAPALGFKSVANTGIFRDSGGFLSIAEVGTVPMAFGSAKAMFKNLAYWTSDGTTTGTADTGIGRNAAGAMEVNTGTLGTIASVVSWHKEIIYGSAATNGVEVPASYFHCNLFSRQNPWPAQTFTNSAAQGYWRSTGGYLSNFTFGVNVPFPATTNIVFTLRTNVLAAGGGMLPGLVAAGLTGTLRGSATTATFTNVPNIADFITANEVVALEIVPSAALKTVTNFWWSVEYWHSDP